MRMGWTGYVTCSGEEYGILVGKAKRRGHIEDLGVYGNLVFNTDLNTITLVAMKWLHLA